MRQNSTEFDTSDTGSDLSAVQQQVVAALARGRTITAAAAEAQLHRSTIYNWLNTLRAFNAALADARSQYAEQLRDEMKELSATALETLRTLLQDPQTSSTVRLRASLAILERQDWSLPADASEAEPPHSPAEPRP
jgi:transposase-like protein